MELHKQGTKVSATFKIVFNGQLYQNTDLTFAQEQLSQLLNIPHNIVVQLFDGKAYALKKDLSSIDAVKTESSLKKLGLVTKVEPQRTTAISQSQNNQIALTEHSKNTDKHISESTDGKSISIQNKHLDTGEAPNTVPAIRQPYNKYKLLRNTLKSALYFCYCALCIMTIIGVVISVNALKNNFGTLNNTTINNTTTNNLSYQNYKQYLIDQNSLNQPTQKVTNSQTANASQQKSNEYFSRFSSLINSYAQSTGQADIKTMGGDKLQQHLQEIDDLGPKNEFWQQLIQLSKSLDNDKHAIGMLNNTDPAKVQWINAVDWISQSYIRQQQNTQATNTSPANADEQSCNPILNLTLLISMLSLFSIFIIAIKMKLRAIRNT
ncbi:hypothetical protein P20652_2444 [Pseudoalteromonas sp. BSi20652]|uniref:hypothetical protein n=1 Tax=Pseudoalteromonas sp. BSi20652 TaxID=388384 RepID=UPI000231867F|nr:hypothetical protein [Pseudoalteromonas sp. BSi20652]GAA60578.1 hypothetical protein P20652_2444 [Pseudoalteromonas sp. BSi20652]